MTVADLWLEAYSNVLAKDDAEIIRYAGGLLNVDIKGSGAVQTIRTRRSLEQREQEQMTDGWMRRDITRDEVRMGPGRRLQIGEDGIKKSDGE